MMTAPIQCRVFAGHPHLVVELNIIPFPDVETILID
jgi:hypothetical protein